MKEKLLAVIREHPGMTKRVITSYACCPFLEGIKLIYEMEREGLIRKTVHNDMANMEFYEEWYVREG